MTRRFGPVRGSLLLGAGWGLWHLAYAFTPEVAGFDLLAFAQSVLELPLYSLLITWVFERAHRSMAVALAFHAAAHLDHIELSGRGELTLHALHLAVLALAAFAAARSLSRKSLQPATPFSRADVVVD
jgi:hypothetical protein